VKSTVIERRDEWDALVQNLGGQPMQAWAWGDLKERFGWRAYRLASSDGKSAAQLLVRRYRGLAVAYVPRGPVMAAGGTLDSVLLEELLGLARAQRAAFVRFEPDLADDDPRAQALEATLRAAKFRVSERSIQPRSTIRVDLNPPLERVRAAFSTGRKGRIRTAERDGVTVRVGDGPADVERLHQTLTATAQRKGGFGIHSLAYYRALVDAFGDDARIFLGERETEVVSAQLVLAYGTYGAYLVGSSTAAGLKYHAAHLVQWHAIRWARERGVRTWDLWGISDARGQLELAEKRATALPKADLARLEESARRDPLDSLIGFKKGWGGEIVRHVPAYDRVFFRPAYWLWQLRRGEA
jgi:lipid II:glycine glycyltransferase (peptidoglycan interpeptide bridge formation enzyme)